MKKIFIAVLAAGVAFCSCNKELQGEVNAVPEGAIVLSIDGSAIDMDVESKAESLPASLYLSRTTGTWKSETSKNASASFNVSSGKINTGWYQTATATAYNYYVANQNITFAADGSTISAPADTDVIAGCTQGATNSTTPSVTLEHVFAKIGTLTCNTQSGYTISNISWKIKSTSGGTGGTAGTYNIATKSWSGVTALSEKAISSNETKYYTSGSYTVSVTYTLTNGDYSSTFTKSGSVTLVGGKINSITCTAIGGNASQIVLSVSLAEWGSQSHTMTLS